MTHDAIEKVILDVANAFSKRGPGWAQEGSVLREVHDRLNPSRPTDLKLQQAILTCWHDLFRTGQLSWGFDLDNPNSPFFHVPERSAQQEAVSA